MKHKISIFRLLALGLIGVSPMAVLAGGIMHQKQNNTPNEVMAVNNSFLGEIKVNLMPAGKGTYKEIRKPRAHIYNIRTYFDDETNFKKSVDVRQLYSVKSNTRRILFEDNSNWANTNILRAYTWKVVNNENVVTSYTWPGTPINKDNNNHYYIDIDNTSEYIIFNNVNWDDHSKGSQTSDIKISDLTFTKTMVTSTSEIKVNDESYFKDNNSQYYFEHVGNVYSHDNPSYFEIGNVIDNDGESIKVKEIIPSQSNIHNASYTFPNFVKSFDIDIVADLSKSDGEYLVKLQSPYHIEKPLGKALKVDLAFSSNGKDVISDTSLKEDKVFGYKKETLSKGTLPSSEHLALYNFMDEYTSIIKHSDYNNDNYSICNSLLDEANKDQIVSLINKFHDHHSINGLNNNNINRLKLIMDKYDTKGNVISIYETMNYIANYMGINQNNIANPLNAIYKGDQSDVIITISLFIGSFALVIISFIFIKKRRKNSILK